MLLVGKQQADAIRAGPVFHTATQKLKHFLLSFLAILQTTKWHEINTLECVHCHFLYPYNVHLREICTSCMIVLNYSILLLLGNGLSSFSFLLKITDMARIIHIAQIVISYERV